MRITATTLRVRDPESGAAALASLLGVPASPDEDGPVVRIGWTAVRPIRNSGHGVDHLAILVPGDGFDVAKAWLAARTTLLTIGGEDVFVGPPGWESLSVYFDGPDGTVLELIAHRGHRDAPGATFPDALLGVCEVGMAVPDVRGFAAGSRMPVFAGTLGDGFAAIGDLDGRLILASPGRAWLPTADRVAGIGHVEVEHDPVP